MLGNGRTSETERPFSEGTRVEGDAPERASAEADASVARCRSALAAVEQQLDLYLAEVQVASEVDSSIAARPHAALEKNGARPKTGVRADNAAGTLPSVQQARQHSTNL